MIQNEEEKGIFSDMRFSKPFVLIVLRELILLLNAYRKTLKLVFKVIIWNKKGSFY